MMLDELDVAVKVLCPIDGVNSNGVIFFRPKATSDQRVVAQALMNTNLDTLVVSRL